MATLMPAGTLVKVCSFGATFHMGCCVSRGVTSKEQKRPFASKFPAGPSHFVINRSDIGNSPYYFLSLFRVILIALPRKHNVHETDHVSQNCNGGHKFVDKFGELQKQMHQGNWSISVNCWMYQSTDSWWQHADRSGALWRLHLKQLRDCCVDELCPQKGICTLCEENFRCYVRCITMSCEQTHWQ